MKTLNTESRLVNVTKDGNIVEGDVSHVSVFSIDVVDCEKTIGTPDTETVEAMARGTADAIFEFSYYVWFDAFLERLNKLNKGGA